MSTARSGLPPSSRTNGTSRPTSPARPARRRRRASPLLLLVLLAGVALGAGPAAATGDQVPLLVRFRDGLGGPERQLVERLRGEVRRELGDFAVAALSVPADRVAALRHDPRVELVEPDPWRFPASLAGKELAPSASNGLYGLVLTGALTAQGRGITGKGVAVCVVDSGIDARHPDLAPVYRGGVDTLDDDDDPDVGPDPVLGDHGTKVAGVVAAAFNRTGVRGMAYGAALFHGRALGNGGGRSSDIMDAVRILVERHGCRVVNLSLGSTQSSALEEDFYRELVARHDVLVVAAAGNDGRPGVIFPAAYPSVVAVGAVDREAAHAGFSNTGPEVDLAAPGVGVLSSAPRGSGNEAAVAVGKRTLEASGFTFAGSTPARGLRKKVIDCGTGNTPEELPKAVRGQIALMRRGDALFATKVENAMNAGAAGAIIYNNVPEPVRGTLGSGTASDGRPWLPAVLVSAADGEQLKRPRTVARLTNVPTDWDLANGTSLAAPHVTGAAALVLSVAPHLGRDALLELLRDTAVDLGDAGPDQHFGWGLVDADAATRAAAAR